MSQLELLQREPPQVAIPMSARLAELDRVRAVQALSERRTHARRRARDLEWLRLVRLTGGTGFSVKLIDLSEGGALLEVDGPLRPGLKLTLEIAGKGLEAAVPLEVLRCYVASLHGGATLYRGACAFDYQIALPSEADRLGPSISSGGFVGADAALTYLLERCVVGPISGSASSESGPFESGTTDRRVMLERVELLHVLESLHARGAAEQGDETARYVVELLGAILPALQGGAPRNVVMAALENRLRAWPNSVQTRLQTTRIRLASLVDHCVLVAPAAAPAPASAADVSEARAAADTVDTDGEKEISLRHLTSQDSAFQKIVVRFAAGDILKGFTQDFHPTRTKFSLWPSINAKPSDRVIVPMAGLKAVFFVRDFAGNPDHRDRKTFTVRGQGRRVEVTFVDTEVVLGTTLNYRPDAQGFFVSPADVSGNNTRVFVVASAVRRVRFL